MDENACDPISIDLFVLILQWAIDENNVFVWFWSLCQWACMAPPANIHPLAFHNFCVGTNNISCKYNDTKKDKTGEKLTEKAIYANPFDF